MNFLTSLLDDKMIILGQEIAYNELFYNLIRTIILIVVMYVADKIIQRIMIKRMKDNRAFYRVRRLVNYLFLFLAVAIILSIWLQKTRAFSTYFGLFTAGLAVALKDLIINIAAWLFIIVKRPLKIGDRIELDGVKGDVIDIRLFQFSLMEIGNWVDAEQSTGRIVHIPNHRVFNEHLCNYSTGFTHIWNEINVLLTFESDWQKAKQLIQMIADNHNLVVDEAMKKEMMVTARKYYITFKNFSPIVYTDVKDSGIQLSLRYLCKPHEKRGTAQAIWEDILRMVSDHRDINLAYPTMRMTFEEKERGLV